MPKYSVSAIDLQNNKVSEVIEARDEDDLRRLVRAKGLVLTKFAPIVEVERGGKLKSNEVGEFSRQLASMLSSGITIVRAMEILKERDFPPRLLGVFEKLHKDVQLGFTLSESMRLQGQAFPELFINMYASGEASGQLDRVAEKMAVHYEKEHKLSAKAQSAMTYPIVLLVTTFIVIMLLFMFILPTLFDLLEDLDLPLITRVMISISHFVQAHWIWIIIGILVVILVSQVLLARENIRLGFDRMKLRFPTAGKLLRTIYTARFARTLSSLYTSGIPMITALEITSTILNNKYIESQFVDTVSNVRNGDPLSKCIEKVDGFDKKLATTIMIGEETGRLDAMLESTADAFDYEAEIALDKLIQLIQPAMIVILAVIIGAVMLSVMLPIMSLYQSM